MTRFKWTAICASFGHVQQDCEGVDWAVIPYKVLKKANPALFEGMP